MEVRKTSIVNVYVLSLEAFDEEKSVVSYLSETLTEALSDYDYYIYLYLNERRINFISTRESFSFFFFIKYLLHPILNDKQVF